MNLQWNWINDFPDLISRSWRMHTHTHIHARARVRARTCETYIWINLCPTFCAHMSCSSVLRTHAPALTFTQTHTYTHTLTQSHTCIHSHSRTHAYTRTRTHSNLTAEASFQTLAIIRSTSLVLARVCARASTKSQRDTRTNERT